jgi:hypothetical protein
MQGPHQKSTTAPTRDNIVALRADGAVVTVDAISGRLTSVLATGADPRGGIMENPQETAILVTAVSSHGCPSIWELSLGQAGKDPAMIVPKAELPSLSPDGRSLGYVTLDGDCRQTGVAVAPVDLTGRLAGPARRLPLIDVPPPLPITSVAVAPDGTAMALGGGLVDSYLGPRQPTVEVIDPGDAEPIAHARMLADGQGASGPPPAAGQSVTPPRWSYDSPLYAPDGSLLVATGASISVYWSTSMSLTIQALVKNTGPVESMTIGPGGQLAFVDGSGRIELAPSGGTLPVSAEDYSTLPSPFHTLGAGYRSVAWTPGVSAVSATPRPVFSGKVTVPDVIGLTQAEASRRLASVPLPVVVEGMPSSTARAGTVVAENPPPGSVMGCQCTVVLKVARGE